MSDTAYGSELSPDERAKMDAAQLDFEVQGLPSMDKVWGWHEELAEMGTRYTGGPGHVRFTDWLKQQFSAVPGFQLSTDSIKFDRWLAQDWSLSIAQDATKGPSGPVPVSYYYPYSGATGPEGVSGRLVDLGMYLPGLYRPTAFWERATGGIALVQVPASTFPLSHVSAADGRIRAGHELTGGRARL